MTPTDKSNPFYRDWHSQAWRGAKHCPGCGNDAICAGKTRARMECLDCYTAKIIKVKRRIKRAVKKEASS